jgi:uncharacterized membrane protein (DUF485 family)
MQSYINKQWYRARHYPLYFFGPILAFIVFLIPVQQYIPMARFQHYGLALAAWGMAYVLQTIWSWRGLGFWTRLGYLLTGLYFSSAALVFYTNPWFDVRVAVESQEQTNFRHIIGYIYLSVTLILAAIWFMSFAEEHARDAHHEQQEH